MGNGLHHRWSEGERKLRRGESRRNRILIPGSPTPATAKEQATRLPLQIRAHAS